MEYRNLGKTGLKVSRICLGCMSYGVPERGTAPLDAAGRREPAVLTSEPSKPGSISSTPPTSTPTAPARRSLGRRAQGLRQARGGGDRHQGARPHAARTRTARGLSRKAIMTEIDASLRRLGMDYVDLYQIHRWDYDDADRGDAGGAARRGEGRQGALHRRLVDVRLAVLQGALPGRPARLDAVRLDAEPLQPALPRGGARDDAACARTKGSA